MEEQLGSGIPQFQIRHTTWEGYSALVTIWLRRPGFYVVPAIFFSLAVAWVVSGNGWPWPVLPGVVILVSMPYFLALTTVKQQRAVGGISYGFSPEGFSSRSNQVAISYLWTAVRGVRETRRFILIEMNGGSTHAIPLRQITGEQAEQLRGLLRTHVPKNVKLAKR